MPLPAPTTLSPGKLELLYTSGTVNHKVGTNFGATVDITVVPPIRTEATALANVVKAVVPNTVTITAWRITDHAGVSLYEEAFATPIVGTLTLAGDAIGGESGSVAATGKGAPTVGLAAGQVKFTIFPNHYRTGIWANPRVAASLMIGWPAVLAFLNTSTLTGCDFYGSPGQWRSNLCLQMNAHYQKLYGN
jgi:hypothetical protein